LKFLADFILLAGKVALPEKNLNIPLGGFPVKKGFKLSIGSVSNIFPLKPYVDSAFQLLCEAPACCSGQGVKPDQETRNKEYPNFLGLRYKVGCSSISF
jgi:hypothetical protein